MNLDILTDLKLSAHRALWGEIIPSLRKVILKWQPEKETACIVFYHDGVITENVEEHYSCIHTEIHADFISQPNVDYKVIRCDYPFPLPKEEHVIYQRKEPFVDP